MSYALVNDAEMQAFKWVLNIDEVWEYQEYTAIAGSIINLIIYDGLTPCQAPEGFHISEVLGAAQIGDTGY